MVSPVRKFMQERGIGGGMFDFSFIIVWVILMILQELVRGMM
jgi:uncharacterized protein YggT (Ycf19 family)